MTHEQDAWIRDNYPGRSRKELYQLFCEKYGQIVTINQIVAYVKNNKINSGRTGHFEKGKISWNKGKKGFMGANATSFKKGNIPANIKPLFAERISIDGFIEIKVPERNPHTGHKTRYRHKHVWVWEQHHGQTVPADHVVTFKDGNRINCNVENLMLVSRRHLLSLNNNGYKEAPEEIKPTIFILSQLEAKAGFRTSTKRGKRNGRKDCSN